MQQKLTVPMPADAGEERRESVTHFDTGESRSRLCRAAGRLVRGPSSASRQGERDARRERRTPLGIGCRKQGGQPVVPRRRPYGAAAHVPAGPSLTPSRACALPWNQPPEPDPSDRKTASPQAF